MPLVGLGTWEAPPGEVGAAVLAAIESGYRHIDCAAVYRNEREVGEALGRSSVPRSDLFITSKLWNDRRRPEDVRAALLQTLKDLGTDYVDLYLVHWPVVWARGTVMKPDPGASLKEAWRTLEDLVDEGKIRDIGVSNYNEMELEELLSYARIPPAVNQVELHPRLPQDGLVEFCKSKGIALTAYSPLGRGDLMGAGLLGNPTVVRIAAAHDVPPASVLLRWNVQRGIAVIPKSVNPARIRNNADLWRFELTASEMVDLDRLADGTRFCNGPWSTFPDNNVAQRVTGSVFTEIARVVFSFVSIDLQTSGREAL